MLDSFQCDHAHATFDWFRNGSTVNFLQERMPQARLAIGGNHASEMLPLKVAVTGKDALQPADVVLGRLHARSQPLGIVLRLSPVVRSPTTVTVAGSQPPPVPQWKSWTLNADLAALTPVIVADLISEPGVRLERIKWRSGNWSIEGVVYAK